MNDHSSEVPSSLLVRKTGIAAAVMEEEKEKREKGIARWETEAFDDPILYSSGSSLSSRE